MKLDFLTSKITLRNKSVYFSPDFIIGDIKDLMIKGKSFYAFWDDDVGLWSTSELRLGKVVDDITLKEAEDKFKGTGYVYESMGLASSNVKANFNNYCKNLMPDCYHMLNQRVVFSNQETKREDYASFKLPYALAKGTTDAWDTLLERLYGPTERQKIEWAIGCLVSGEQSKHQKCFIFYGDKGTGKSTILNIIDSMFEGYTCPFNAKALGSTTDSYALEPFKDFPLIAIEHEADLSRIESNARLNSLVSHEPMVVNEKFKGLYKASFNTFLFMGTNNPVRITDAKSGLLRRLIDISPTGNLFSVSEYNKLNHDVKFEYGAIAYKCQEFYLKNRHMFASYIPTLMIDETNDTYNFYEEYADILKEKDAVPLSYLWTEYKRYCEDAKVAYPLNKRKFKNESRVYYKEFNDHKKIENKSQRYVYEGFRIDKFRNSIKGTDKEKESEEIVTSGSWIRLESGIPSRFEKLMMDQPAQGIADDGTERPKFKWENCHTVLKDLDTSKVHYVKLPPSHIVIDFDLKDEYGNKSLEKNIEAASSFPPTYAEISKGGGGLHLHYVYTGGNPEELSRVYDDNIEVKVFTGNASLRRRLSLCNDMDISEINSGLPKKEENKVMVNEFVLKNEKALRTKIIRNLKKEYFGATAPSVDFIFKDLEDAYNSGMQYDVTDLRPAIMAFASQSSHQAEKCLKVVGKMRFKSEDPVESVDNEKRIGRAWDDFSRFIFFDVEVFKNLFVLVWKKYGSENKAVTMINPTPMEVEDFIKSGDLIGFNNRDYDNHILYARALGYSELELYELSQRIINNSKNAKFREAYNISYTDIYDFASAGNKISLKKWEVALDIHHLELGLPWDQEVPQELWMKVAEYCINDVLSTEAVFDNLKSDYMARVILADVAGGIPNDTTNTLTKKLIFSGNRTPQSQFQYRFLGDPVKYVDEEVMDFLKEYCPNMTATSFSDDSILPYFKGYTFNYGKSLYKDENPKEGGYVYAEPGMHYNVALIDVTSMHPHSVIAECLFGPRYTKVFYELVYARVYIKHQEWDRLKDVLDGKLAKYVDKILSGEIKGKDLSNALKTAINSVYGLTSAGFKNEFRDERNIDNIVAKRGALFMMDLRDAVKSKGFTVAHIKTDSIKIPDATPEIIDFVLNFGERYGYHFEHEATYSKMCLINDAVYIAKYETKERCQNTYGYIPDKNNEHAGEWTATGARFAEPYVFKTLFSHKPIEFKDLCVTKSVQTSVYLDCNEALKEGEHDYRFVGKVGEFCPVVDGVGGGVIYRVSDKKIKGTDGEYHTETRYDAVTGTKGYRWMESEICKKRGGMDIVDRSYFKALVDDSIFEMSKYGNVEEFMSA